MTRDASAVCAPSTTSTSPSKQGKLVGLIGPNGAGQDDVHRRHHRLRADDRQHRVPRDRRSRTSPRTGAPAAASGARGSRSSCSTISPSRRTCRSRPNASRSGGFLADLVCCRTARRRARTHNVDFALDVLGIRDLAEPHAERDQPGPAQARERRPRAGRPPAARVHGRARRGPRHVRVAGARAPAAPHHRRRDHDLPRRPRHGHSCSTCATTST